MRVQFGSASDEPNRAMWRLQKFSWQPATFFPTQTHLCNKAMEVPQMASVWFFRAYGPVIVEFVGAVLVAVGARRLAGRKAPRTGLSETNMIVVPPQILWPRSPGAEAPSSSASKSPPPEPGARRPQYSASHRSFLQGQVPLLRPRRRTVERNRRSLRSWPSASPAPSDRSHSSADKSRFYVKYGCRRSRTGTTCEGRRSVLRTRSEPPRAIRAAIGRKFRPAIRSARIPYGPLAGRAIRIIAPVTDATRAKRRKISDV